MRDSVEAKICRGCGTEFSLWFECKPDFCQACALVHDDYTPQKDGEPCADCRKPVWYCNDEDQWFHADPDHQCFLAQGKAKPTDPEGRSVRTWTVHVTKVVSMSATFSVKAEDRDAAYDAAEEYAVYGDFMWEDSDPRGEDGVEVQDVEEEEA